LPITPLSPGAHWEYCRIDADFCGAADLYIRRRVVLRNCCVSVDLNELGLRSFAESPFGLPASGTDFAIRNALLYRGNHSLRGAVLPGLRRPVER